jgi:hypothetical protein
MASVVVSSGETCLLTVVLSRSSPPSLSPRSTAIERMGQGSAPSRFRAVTTYRSKYRVRNARSSPHTRLRWVCDRDVAPAQAVVGASSSLRVTGPVEDRRFVIVDLLEDEVTLIVSPRHPFAGRASVSAAEVAAEADGRQVHHRHGRARQARLRELGQRQRALRR